MIVRFLFFPRYALKASFRAERLVSSFKNRTEMVLFLDYCFCE